MQIKKLGFLDELIGGAFDALTISDIPTPAPDCPCDPHR